MANRPTIVCELGPNAIYTRHCRLPTEPSLRAYLSRKKRDLAGKLLELVYHAVDRLLKSSNFGILFRSVYEHLFAQVAIGNSRDDSSNVFEHLLIGRIDLGVLVDFPFHLVDRARVAESLQGLLGGILLLLHLRFDVVDDLLLRANLRLLLLEHVSEVPELLLRELSRM